ncbi:MAG: aldo/keto reductase [candidate division Zixibacteria bacterium SM23_81]|nr:MAG: aldo/keto reductase [candidate division Zixibacteria bacterium SM23_81]
MQYTQLGKKGPIVSTIGFGAWAIGGVNWGPTDDEVSKKALHQALDLGVTFIDTADVYGNGHSEKLIAEVFKERGKGDVIVATKMGNDFYHADESDDTGFGPIRANYDLKYLIWAAEQSLKRLRLETIDIMQLHSPTTELAQRDEPWEALLRLKEQGKILHAGISIISFAETEQAFLLDEHHDLLDCIQVRYNLLEREAEKELFPKAQEHGIGVIVRIPILFGLLTGKFNRQSQFGEDDHRRHTLSPEKLGEYLDKLDDLKPFYDRYPDQTMTQTSLRFCISHPACHTAIPGAKTPKQVRENCAASDLGPFPLEEIPEGQ